MTESLWEFLRMGGYARYVWPPYLFAAVLLFAAAYYAAHRRRRALRDIRRRAR